MITPIEGWVRDKSPNPYVHILKNKKTKEIIVIGQMPNPNGDDISKINLKNQMLKEMRGTRKLLKQKVYSNQNEIDISYYALNDGKENKVMQVFAFFSDKTHMYRTMIMLKNDETSFSRLHKILDMFKRKKA